MFNHFKALSNLNQTTLQTALIPMFPIIFPLSSLQKKDMSLKNSLALSLLYSRALTVLFGRLAGEEALVHGLIQQNLGGSHPFFKRP